MSITTDISIDEQRALDEIRSRLIAAYPDADAAAVEHAIDTAHRRFDHGTIRDFVPLFVERYARKHLS